MRTTIGVARRRKKNRLFQKAKGYVGGRRRLLRTMKENLVRAEAFAFRDRRARKREFRKLWIIRINAACRERGLRYSEFTPAQQAAIELDRKRSVSQRSRPSRPTPSSKKLLSGIRRHTRGDQTVSGASRERCHPAHDSRRRMAGGAPDGTAQSVGRRPAPADYATCGQCCRRSAPAASEMLPRYFWAAPCCIRRPYATRSVLGARVVQGATFSGVTLRPNDLVCWALIT
jgi:large subunit ribosomal protein L20